MDPATHPPKLARLLAFLEADPCNPNLLADAASAAYEAGDLALAEDLLERHEAAAPLSGTPLNLKGLIALDRRHYAEAAGIFEILRRSGDNPALRFNLAWALAMQEKFRETLDLLDDETVAVSPAAPALKIHAMHHLGLYEEAFATGQVLAERFPKNEDLMGALATLALDIEKPDLARRYAERAGRNAEGSTALGFLALGDHKVEESYDRFEKAIAAQPQNPRAWLGKGLSLLSSGNAGAAAKAIDRGAALFGNHVGSWIASGWAHAIQGDTIKARESFERALAVEPNFSECHGGLAVMDILTGNLAEAKRRTDIALRLDRNCFGAALAKSLLLQRSGHAEAARKILEKAFATPIGMQGRTIGRELLALGLHRPKIGEAPKRHG